MERKPITYFIKERKVYLFLIKIKKKTLFYFYIINIIHKYFFKDADDQDDERWNFSSWKCWNPYHEHCRSFHCFLIRKIKSKLGNHPKTRSDLEYVALLSPGLILISNSTNNANEIKGGAYVPLAAE